MHVYPGSALAAPWSEYRYWVAATENNMMAYLIRSCPPVTRPGANSFSVEESHA